MFGKAPVTVKIAHVNITAPGGYIAYENIEITGKPADVDTALAAIFRSGVARLEVDPPPVRHDPTSLVDLEALRASVTGGPVSSGGPAPMA